MKDEKAVWERGSHVLVTGLYAVMCLLLVYFPLSGVILSQEEKTSDTHSSNKRDPLSKHKGGTRARASAPSHTTVGGARAKGGTHPVSHGIAHQPAGIRNVSLKSGGTVSVRKNGSIRSIDRNGMHIEHGVHGVRTILSTHNGALVVSTGSGSGYVQRVYVTRSGRSYYSRTYYDRGVYRAAVYRGYSYGGRTYYSYYPSYWYHPAFYVWAYSAWSAPVIWGVGAWGWGGAPWWGYYGGYFTPYPVYASPAFWLTDDVLASNLQAEYAVQSAANTAAAAADSAAADSGAIMLSSDVKQAVADEVKIQLEAQAAQTAQAGDAGASSSPASITQLKDQVPPALDPRQRTFVVSSDITVVANGRDCGLTGGDVITRVADTPDADSMVAASVSASKRGDCAAGATVDVKVDDLQEMYNHFQEQLANGLAELAKKQGTNGMPKAPDAGTMASDVPPPAPDDTASKMLADQRAEADRTELEVKEELGASGEGK